MRRGISFVETRTSTEDDRKQVIVLLPRFLFGSDQTETGVTGRMCVRKWSGTSLGGGSGDNGGTLIRPKPETDCPSEGENESYCANQKTKKAEHKVFKLVRIWRGLGRRETAQDVVCVCLGGQGASPEKLHVEEGKKWLGWMAGSGC